MSRPAGPADRFLLALGAALLAAGLLLRFTGAPWWGGCLVACGAAMAGSRLPLWVRHRRRR